MSNLVSKIENVLLTGPLDAVCGSNVVYLAMNSNNLSKYELSSVKKGEIANFIILRKMEKTGLTHNIKI